MVEVGMLQSCYFFATAISEIPAGVIGDKIGRKNSLIIGNILKLVGVACFLIANDFYVFSSLMMLQGIGMAFISGSDQALLYDNLKARKREQQFINMSAITNAVLFLSAFIATILGGWLQTVTWSAVFIITSLAIVVAIYFITTIDDEEGVVMKRQAVSLKTMLKNFVAHNTKSITCLIIGTALFDATYLCFFMLSQKFFLKFEVSIFLISILYAISRVCSMIMYYLLPKLRACISDRYLLGFSFLLMPIIFLISMVDNGVLYITLFFVISVIGHIAPSIYAGKFNDMLPSIYRSTFLSISSLISSLILSFLYLFAGSLLESSYASLHFVLLAIIGVCGEALIFFTLKKTRDI